ncbi:(deoxy)nucleoside triphosphate pyrophosphohydrolase [Mucilaginibacter sp. BJC16-A38]|nr:(deoxy)nucleoside triphosphate pyrophosphohydrolase [Mucilaginibacter phenanthrenivorans]
MIDVTCALIIDDQNRVFAAQRSSTMGLPLKWELPGGKIESGETAEACLVREIHEELNIEIEIVTGLNANVHDYPSITIKLIPFICKHLKGEILLKEHADFKWLTKKELLDLDWAAADVPILHNYLNYLNAI